MTMLSINGLTTYRWTLDEDMVFAKQAGFDAVGIWRRKLEDFGEERAIDLLEETGLAVSCLGWAGGFTGADGRSLDHSIQDGLAAVRTAARIHAGCLIVYSGGQNSHIHSHANRLLRQGLDELLKAAELADVTLALKPLHPACASEWSFRTDLTTAIDFVEEYGSPHLRLVYDSYHFPKILDQPCLVDRLVPLLSLVQLADARRPHCAEQDRCPLGEGTLPLGEIVASLLNAGYQGPIDVELMGSEIEAADNQRLLASSYQALDAYTHGCQARSLLTTGAPFAYDR